MVGEVVSFNVNTDALTKLMLLWFLIASYAGSHIICSQTTYTYIYRMYAYVYLFI